MAYFRRCIKCGCTLDPGEGDKCCDCIEKEITAEQLSKILVTKEYEQLTLIGI
jgi:hypothetical protein